MAQKKARDTGFTDCTCDKCGITGHARSGGRHRRCPGLEGQARKEKHEKLPSGERGRWQ